MTASTGSPSVIVELDAPIARITFNRPQVANALDPEAVITLAEAWIEVDRDPSIRVVIVTGTGHRAFCAGADFTRLASLRTGAREPEDDWDRRFLADPRWFPAAALRDRLVSTPIVAAVNGHAHGARLELLLGTDIRIASDTATFAVPEVRRGLIAAGGTLTRLPRQVGTARAMEMLLTGDPVDARTAAEIGLVNRVVASEDLAAEALRLAERIATAAPLSVQASKAAAIRTSGRPLEEGYAIEDKAAAAIRRSSDAREGPRAFLENREPVFTGE